jgi:hypothetical protein
MTYQEFKETICTMVQAKFGGTTNVMVQDVVKNNDTHFDGLIVQSKGQNISPTIYLNSYYNQLQCGMSLAQISQSIFDVYRQCNPGQSIDISFFTDYDKVKSRIVFKLINYEKNKKLLEQVPHFRFLDLAIVFYYLLNTGNNSNATILIYKHHLPLWGITKDDLYALATANTPQLLRYELRNMTDVLCEVFSETREFSNEMNELKQLCPMYVLTNRNKLNGSGCILYTNLLRDFSNRLCSDLYIIPSSIHEVLLVPARCGSGYHELSQMVRDVNDAELSKEEILSDHVYYFSRETGKITM